MPRHTIIPNMSEDEFIAATNLTKLRIVKTILSDILPQGDEEVGVTASLHKLLDVFLTKIQRKIPNLD